MLSVDPQETLREFNLPIFNQVLVCLTSKITLIFSAVTLNLRSPSTHLMRLQLSRPIHLKQLSTRSQVNHLSQLFKSIKKKLLECNHLFLEFQPHLMGFQAFLAQNLQKKVNLTWIWVNKSKNHNLNFLK